MQHADINAEHDRHHQHTDRDGKTVGVFHPGPAAEVKDHQHAEQPQDIVDKRNVDLTFRV